MNYCCKLFSTSSCVAKQSFPGINAIVDLTGQLAHQQTSSLDQWFQIWGSLAGEVHFVISLDRCNFIKKSEKNSMVENS